MNATVSFTDPVAQRCYYHPDVETRLRCSRCEKPICPRCMVSTPVGFRCPDCARGPKPVLYTTTPTGMAKAVIVGLVVAIGVGVLWGYFPEWRFYCALLLGFGISESVSKVTNYRRGRELMTIAMVCVGIGLVVSRLAIAGFDDVLTVDMLLNETSNNAVANRFQLEFIPDVVFMAIPFAINYVRFR